MRDTLAEIKGTVDELNPRRIVADSLRAVEPSYGTQTSSFVDDAQQSSSVPVPPPDADVAEANSANSMASNSPGDTSVGAPVLGGFHDVLVDVDTADATAVTP